VPEKRKVGSSTLPLTTDTQCTDVRKRDLGRPRQIPASDRYGPYVTATRRALSHGNRTKLRGGMDPVSLVVAALTLGAMEGVRDTRLGHET
jgi:hypothetical protein